MSGVTRRRQAGGSSANNDVNVPSRSSTPARNNGSGVREEAAKDHKIAFDPKDIEQGEERARQPKLTLMEEVLLLGLKDREVRHTSLLLFIID